METDQSRSEDTSRDDESDDTTLDRLRGG